MLCTALGDSLSLVISYKLFVRRTQIISKLQKISHEPASDFKSSNAALLTSRLSIKKSLMYGYRTWATQHSLDQWW